VTQIPEWQRDLHVSSELAALILTPFVLMAAADAREPHKSRLQALAAGTLLVDGLLLYRWWRSA
jgi:hypothetical protein